MIENKFKVVKWLPSTERIRYTKDLTVADMIRSQSIDRLVARSGPPRAQQPKYVIKTILKRN